MAHNFLSGGGSIPIQRPPTGDDAADKAAYKEYLLQLWDNFDRDIEREERLMHRQGRIFLVVFVIMMVIVVGMFIAATINIWT